MTNNFDLNTHLLRNGTVSMISNLGAVIPAGKTRFLTYIRVERLKSVGVGSSATAIDVVVGSCVTGAADIVNAGSVASYHHKLTLKIASVTTAGIAIQPNEMLLRNEIKGSIEEPILNVAGGNYMMVAVIGECASAVVFAQYFDE